MKVQTLICSSDKYFLECFSSYIVGHSDMNFDITFYTDFKSLSDKNITDLIKAFREASSLNRYCLAAILYVRVVLSGAEADNEEALPAQCYYNSLTVAVEHGIRTVAFPSIATGIYHFPVEKAVKIAVTTAVSFIKEHPGQLDRVVWVLFDDATLAVYDNALKKYNDD